METRAHYVAVGAFVLTMVFAAFVAALWLGGVELTTRYAKYLAYFHGAVTGLTKGASVEYNGIPVGRVSNIRIDPQDVERIEVEMEIDSNVVIKADAKAEVQSNLLSGVSFILITKGTREAPPLVAKPGERYPVIASRRSALASVYARGPALLDQLSRIGDHLEEILNEHNRQAISEMLDNLRTVTADFAVHGKDITRLVDNADQSLDTLNKLLADIGDSYSGENGIRDKTKRSLDELSTLLRNLDRSYTNPGGINDRVAKVLADVDESARELRAMLGEARTTLRDARPAVRSFGERTVPEINDLLREARQFVAGLTRLGEQIERDPSRLLYGDRREGYRPR
jgi:phospholipid/cholesterol/gamma-HCH transport system substrate-binding protein